MGPKQDSPTKAQASAAESPQPKVHPSKGIGKGGVQATPETGADGTGSAEAHKEAWKSFILSIDSDAEDIDLDAVLDFFTSTRVKTSSQLAENSMTDLESVEEWPRALRVRALLRQAHKHACALHKGSTASQPDFAQQTTVARTSSVVAAAEAAAEQEQMKLIGGSVANALTITRMLRHKHSLDIPTSLSRVGLAKLGFFHTPGDLLFQALNNIVKEHEAEEAAAEGQGEDFATPVCFPYVDITRADVIAPWLTPESIGASSDLAGEPQMDASAHTDSVGKLGKALTQLTEKRRFFRTFSQWLVAFLRFTVAAMSVGLFKLELAFLHIFVVVRLIEDERQWGENQGITNGSTYLGIYYDELHRQAVARRADRGDTDLDLVLAFRKIDKETLALAKSKLADTLQRSGVSTRVKQQGGGQQATPQASPYQQYVPPAAAAQVQLARGGAELAAQQGAIRQGQQKGGGRGQGGGRQAPAPPPPPPPPGGQQQQGQVSNRQAKRKLWVGAQKAKRQRG